MSLKLKLQNPDSCDGCSHLKDLSTLGGHKQCDVYKKNMLPLDDVSMAVKKRGRIERPQICKDENDS